MLRSDAKLPNELLGILAAVAYPISVWQLGLTGALLVTGALLIALLVWYVFWSRARVGDVGVSFVGAAYTGLLMSSLILVRMGVPGIWGGVLVVGIFCSVWANDSFAYLVGSKFGKHKMAPRLSPKKSVEGGIGGVAGAALLGVLFALAMNQWGGAQANPLHYAIICAAGGMISQVGDLAASAIKRNHDIKDYGKLIPGHGGILDRFDSVIFTAPVIYYLAALLAGNI